MTRRGAKSASLAVGKPSAPEADPDRHSGADSGPRQDRRAPSSQQVGAIGFSHGPGDPDELPDIGPAPDVWREFEAAARREASSDQDPAGPAVSWAEGLDAETCLREAERLVEALIFAVPEVSRATLEARLPRQAPLDLVLERLKGFYQNRAPQLIEGPAGWRFSVAIPAELDHQERPVARGFSEAAKATLAFIALHQPVTTAEINAWRGVRTAQSVFKLLLRLDLIAEGSRRHEPGEPVTWVTTPGFLKLLDLGSIDDLPAPGDVLDLPESEAE